MDHTLQTLNEYCMAETYLNELGTYNGAVDSLFESLGLG